MNTEKRFLTANDVMEIAGVKRSKAYSIIHDLNKELEKKGYLVLNGKVIASYFYERLFGKENKNGGL